jgi:hypothetical protein
VALSVLANQALALSVGRSTLAWVEDAPFTARVLNLSSAELEEQAQTLATGLTGAPA